MTTDALRNLWKEAFGDSDDFLDGFFAKGYSADRCMTLEDKAALYWFDGACSGKKLAYLYAVATQKSHRGQGLCHRLMEKTHAHLARQGYSGVILVPGRAELFRFYETMGYQTFGYVDRLTCAAGKPLSIRQITPEQYGRMRMERMPAAGVDQQGAALDFLGTYARFYAGEDVIAAVTVDGNRVIGHELLGDTEKAAGITAALGCETGVFRIPGDQIPFAMYLSLDATSAPGYFGIALD